MPASFRRPLVAAAFVAAAAAGLSAGGWSVITLNDFPDYGMAGKPLGLTFSVRQHGIHPVSGLKPVVKASAPGVAPVVVQALPTTKAGEYTATLLLEKTGDWSLVVDGGFNPEDKTRRYNAVTLPLLRVVPAGAAPLVLFSEAERGATMLVTKGCVSCHGPGTDRDLLRKQLGAEAVKAFLADPAARQIDMPNLGLKPAEISALAAYLSGSGLTTARR
jgi:hypothetical protein